MGEKNVLPKIGPAVLQIALGAPWRGWEVFVFVSPMDHANLPPPPLLFLQVRIEE